MTVSQLAAALRFEPLNLADGDRPVTGGYAGDLLSWVMSRARGGDCWVTIMSNVNVAAVAQLTDVACVVFAESVMPDAVALEAVRTHKINLFTSRMPAFELCAAVAAALT